jgi:hypothetical protein
VAASRALANASRFREVFEAEPNLECVEFRNTDYC